MDPGMKIRVFVLLIFVFGMAFTLISVTNLGQVVGGSIHTTPTNVLASSIVVPIIQDTINSTLSPEEKMILLEQKAQTLPPKGMPEQVREILEKENQLYENQVKNHPTISNNYILLLSSSGLSILLPSQRTKENQRIMGVQNGVRNIVGEAFHGATRNTINAIFLRGISPQKLKESVDFARQTYPQARVFRDGTKRPTLMDSVPLIGADQVHDFGYTGTGVKVSIIDTGIDYTHPDLGGCASFFNCPKFVGGYDFSSGDADPMDELGHGTHVAGIVASNGALKGVAPDAKLGNYRVCDAGGSCYDSDIISAVDASLDPNGDLDYGDKYDIISMSLGGPGTPDEPLSLSVDAANDAGILVNVAAGNFWSGSEYGDLSCPGCARKAFTVGATTKQDELSYFSGKGPVFYGSELLIKPNIVAPGTDICSAQWDDAYSWALTNCNNDDVHVGISGTSMATPHISGVAALLIQSLAYQSTPEQLKAILSQSTKDIGLDIFQQGGGRVNAYEVLGEQVYSDPSLINVGLITSPTGNKTINVNLLNNYFQAYDAGVVLKSFVLKNVQTGQEYTFPSSQGQYCIPKASQSLPVQFDIDTAPLTYGYYSGYLEMDLYNGCNFTTGFSQTVKVPAGGAKVYPLTITFKGTPAGSSYYLNHYNIFSLVNLQGKSKLKWNYEYGNNSTFVYTAYSADAEVDVLGLMSEYDYLPIYDKTTLTYFTRHVDLSQVDSITFDYSQAKTVNHNIVQTMNSKGLSPFGVKSQLLKKGDFYSDLIYFYYPDMGEMKEIKLGVDMQDVKKLFNQDYQVDFSFHGKDTGKTVSTTQNYSILPIVIDVSSLSAVISPPSSSPTPTGTAAIGPTFNKIILPGSLKEIPLTIPATLTPYFTSNTYFGVGSYSTSNYSFYYNPQQISIPRLGKFYYLGDCDQCHYLYHLEVYDPGSGDNAYIWTNYFDGKEKYLPETDNTKPPFVSFFESPLSLGLSTSHCVQWQPGEYYFCDSAVLRGGLFDKFGAKTHLMTEGTSGNLTIKVPSGSTYSIFSEDNSVLAFGQFGSWVMDCTPVNSTTPSQSFPYNLNNNPEFCQDGTYQIMWEMPDVVKDKTLKLWATVEHSNGKFMITEACTNSSNNTVMVCASKAGPLSSV